MKTLIAVSGVALFVGFMGVVHSKSARTFLGMGGCPLGYDKLRSAEEKEAYRRAHAEQYAGPRSASARPAHGFELAVTRREDVVAWALSEGATCTRPSVGYDLTCDTLDGQSAWLDFSTDGVLAVAVIVNHKDSAAAAQVAFVSANTEIATRAGKATSISGPASASDLRLLEQSVAEYRFADYYALARSSNLGGRYVVTEEYRLLR